MIEYLLSGSIPDGPPAKASGKISDPPVSEREALVIQLLAEGKTVADVAREMYIAEKTVTNHLRNIAEKFRGGTSVRKESAGQSERLLEHLGSALKRSERFAARTISILSAEQQMLPVRFSEEQHRQLKDWCTRHNFSMAVVVRGLVERFLEDQARRAS